MAFFSAPPASLKMSSFSAPLPSLKMSSPPPYLKMTSSSSSFFGARLQCFNMRGNELLEEQKEEELFPKPPFPGPEDDDRFVSTPSFEFLSTPSSEFLGVAGKDDLKLSSEFAGKDDLKLSSEFVMYAFALHMLSSGGNNKVSTPKEDIKAPNPILTGTTDQIVKTIFGLILSSIVSFYYEIMVVYVNKNYSEIVN